MGVPLYALMCTTAVSLVAFATSFIPGSDLFTVLTTLVGVAGLTTWFGITVAHYRFRRAFAEQGRDLSDLPMRTPLHPFGDIFSMIACIAVALMTGYSYFKPANAVGLIGNYGGLILCLLGFTITKFYTKSKLVPLERMDLDTGRSDRKWTTEDEEDAMKLLWRRVRHTMT